MWRGIDRETWRVQRIDDDADTLRHARGETKKGRRRRPFVTDGAPCPHE
jgi:hypothetical protein